MPTIFNVVKYAKYMNIKGYILGSLIGIKLQVVSVEICSKMVLKQNKFERKAIEIIFLHDIVVKTKPKTMSHESICGGYAWAGILPKQMVELWCR